MFTVLLILITSATTAVVSGWGYINVFNHMSYPLRQDQSGQSGLSCAVNVVLHILEPSQSEYASSFVGRLIITLIKQVRRTPIIAHH